MMSTTHFCIIGSGIAGMSLALRLAEQSKKNIVLITQSEIISGSTPLAQGGIAAVAANTHDSFESHYEDTMKAGHCTNDPKGVKVLVESAPAVIQDLEKWGVKFHTQQHLEGGHSYPRVFNTGDSTGKDVAEKLAKKIQDLEQQQKITILTHAECIDFEYANPKKNNQIRVTLKQKRKNKKNILQQLTCQKLFFATGGYASRFPVFTTPSEAKGHAIDLFKKKGGRIKNMELVQFHPTALDKESIPRFLISEAVRGAGARIVDISGKEICDPLLPRDIVSKKILDAEKNSPKQASQKNQIFLDCRTIENFEDKFVHIYKTLTEKFSLTPNTDLIPITPAAHYCMGGIQTNIWGETNLNNIFALGECAHTGVHGNNRLASNSLLEGLVFSRQIVSLLNTKKEL